MKKRKNKSIALFLTLICTSMALAGCSMQKTPVMAENSPTETISLNSFESNFDFNYLMMSNSLGKVSMNWNAQYVSDGEGSACVYVQPDVFNGMMEAKVPGLYQALKLERAGEDYTNFRYVTKVKTKVYNPDSAEKEIGLQLVYTVKNRSLVTGKAQWYTLAPNAWTEIVFEIGSTTIPVAYKKKACGVNFVFKRPAEDAEGYTLYLDDFALEKKVLS